MKKTAKKLMKNYSKEEKRHDVAYEKENSKHEGRHSKEIKEALKIGKKKKGSCKED